MFNSQPITRGFLEKFNNEIYDYLNQNSNIKVAEQNIKNYLKEMNIDESDFEELLDDLIIVAQEISYLKGIEDGAKLHYELISGNVVNGFMEAFNEKIAS